MIIEKVKEQLKDKRLNESFGQVEVVNNEFLISKGPICKIGDICEVGQQKNLCEVISIRNNMIYLMPLYSLKNVVSGDKVKVKDIQVQLPDVNKLLGKVINGMGESLTEGLELESLKKTNCELDNDPLNAMDRSRIDTVISTGVKAIDTMTTIGEGQKLAVFAGSGVGKSTLLGMVARNVETDINVIALIGERGREVKEFIEKDLGSEGMSRSVVIVSTSDEKPLLHIKAAQLATSISEKFRDQNRKVMLMMDSVTRYALARREVDIASGEIPINGKTISMEPYMQRLMERVGKSNGGSITGIYTVLVENDDFNGPIPDMARGILDGHIILSRELSERNQYPAIDVMASISRVMKDIVDHEQWELVHLARKYMSIYKENEDFFKIADIKPGQDKDLDIARYLYPRLQEFLSQGIDEHVGFSEALEGLKGVMK